MITITTMPHSEQRYDTCGDWVIHNNGDIYIFVSETGDWRSNLLVAVHELVEASLCFDRNIDQKEVDSFDMEYESGRDYGDETSEPGDSPNAPYRREHRFAENIERQLAHELNVEWVDHEERIINLGY